MACIRFQRSIFYRGRALLSSKRFFSAANPNDNSEYTHFGFQEVKENEKQAKVNEVFRNVADRYDLMNDAMSLGIHRLWKDWFIANAGPRVGMVCLDVAGGTGDIAFRMVKHARYHKPSSWPRAIPNVKVSFDQAGPTSVNSGARPPHSPSATVQRPVQVDQRTIDQFVASAPDVSSDFDEQVLRQSTAAAAAASSTTFTASTGPGASAGSVPQSNPQDISVTVCDISREMMGVGQERCRRLGYEGAVRWVHGNAEQLPFPDNSFDLYTIAFGIRNCTHVQQVLNEAHRVLKPYGRFMCLEFSEMTNPLLRTMYDEYSFQVIPVMGQILAADWDSYQYLVESIRRFPNQARFADMLRLAGLRCVQYENFTGGIAAVHSGIKLT